MDEQTSKNVNEQGLQKPSPQDNDKAANVGATPSVAVRSTSTRKKSQPSLNDELDQIDRKMLQLIVERPGIKLSELGIAVELNIRNVWKRTNRDIFKRALKKLQEKPIDVVINNKVRAINNLARIATMPVDEELIKENPKAVANIIKAAIALCADVLPAVQVNHSGHVQHTLFDGIRFITFQSRTNGEAGEKDASALQRLN